MVVAATVAVACGAQEERPLAYSVPAAAYWFGPVAEEWKPPVDTVRGLGFNAIRLSMPWRQIYPEPLLDEGGNIGAPDFSWFDVIADHAVNECGMKLIIKDVPCYYPDWLEAEFEEREFEALRLTPHSGKLKARDRELPATNICIAHPRMRELLCTSTELIAEHLLKRYGRDSILSIETPAITLTIESEYAMYADYSAPAQQDFRAWLQGQYATVDELNDAWGTQLADFAEVRPPALVWEDVPEQNVEAGFPLIRFRQDDPDTDITDKPYLDWQRYRHFALKRHLSEVADVVHGHGLKAGAQFGCVFDFIAPARGTVGFADLCEDIDVVIADDGMDERQEGPWPAVYDHRFSADVLRGSLPGKLWGTAVMPNLAEPEDDPALFAAREANGRRQIAATYDRGGWFVEWDGGRIGAEMGLDVTRYRFVEEALWRIRQPMPDVEPVARMHVSTVEFWRRFVNVPFANSLLEEWRGLSDDGARMVDVVFEYDG